MTNYLKTMAESLMEVRKIEEATMKASQIAQLKKAYEPMRGKRISTGNAQKLSKMMDGFDDNKQLMIQLVKADIPFVSTLAITRLISKHNMKGAEINKLKKEEMEFWESLEEHKGDKPHDHPHDEDELDEVQKVARQLKDPKKEVMLVKKNKVIVVDRKDEKKYLSKGWQLAEEDELDEDDKLSIGDRVAEQLARIKGSTSFDEAEVELDERPAQYPLYHKTFSAAMDTAYRHAKKAYGITVKSSEIDDKVATGPRKPSKGKTNKYRLEGDKGAIQVQVYNTGHKDGTYELNMYKEEVELDERELTDTEKKRREEIAQDMNDADFKDQYGDRWKEVKMAVATKQAKNEEVELDEGKMKELHMYIQQGKSAKEIAKIMKLDVKTIQSLMAGYKESYKFGTDEYREYLEKLTPGEGTQEASARADAARHMRRDKKVDPADVDIDASPEDIKGASKNIIMQMRKVVSMRGNFPVEFLDKKKVKLPAKIAQKVQNKYDSFKKPADKAKFQVKVAKSYKSMLTALKEEVKETILDRIDRKLKERKNG